MAELSDDLVSAARAGDPDAVGTVYTVLSPKVLGYLRARGAEDPEGLTSEVFLQVITKLGRLGGARLSFAHSCSRWPMPGRRRHPPPGTSSGDVVLRTRVRLARDLLRRGDAMEDASAQRVRDVLDQLNEEQRAVIALRVLGDLTLEQTADVVGKSTGAVKQLQRRGLLELRPLVERGEVAL